MGIISWVIIGALVGWIATMITGKNKEIGAVANIVAGIVGGIIGGVIMNILAGRGITGFDIWSLLVAVMGAIILLRIVSVVEKKT